MVSQVQIRIRARAAESDRQTAMNTKTPRTVKRKEALMCFFDIHALENTGAPSDSLCCSNLIVVVILHPWPL